MYSDEIIARRVNSIERDFRVKLHRYDISESAEITRYISSAYDDRGRQIRALDPREQNFIWNEMALCRSDFKYWVHRYAQIILDSALGKRGNITFTPAQEIIHSRMSVTEDRMWHEYDLGHDRFDGQCYFMHKAGQMGISTHCELVGIHLINFNADTMGLIGSIDDQKTQKVYTDYFLSVYESMPPWMRSPLRSKVKDRGLDFSSGSLVQLQDASQKSGFGQGSKWHYVHVTELASWFDPATQFEKHLLPRISYSIRATAFAESNSQGMHDWWHEHTEMARRHEYNRWQYIFIGWWMVPQFNRAYPPDGWLPAAHTIEEEQLIIKHSAEFNGGVTARPTREMLYWWESKRSTYQKAGTLAEFYKEHPSIPEQSFTHSGRSSFEYEVLESLQRQVEAPVPYQLATKDLPSELVISDDGRPGSPKIIPVPGTGYDLVPVIVPDSMRTDPRGLILIWELPSNQHDYFGGADTAIGIANWSRYLRKKNDERTDNAVIELIRKGFYNKPDVQVCEFAAPIFPQDFALYINLLGRLYCGRGEEEQCLFTVEVNNGGSICQSELMNRYEYLNLYQRYNTKDGVHVNYLDQLGWLTNIQTITELWTMGKKHISDGHFLARSKYLVNEFRDCTDDDARFKVIRTMMRGKAEGKDKASGTFKHDDRAYATLFALEGAHSFSQYGNVMAPSTLSKPIILPESPRKLSVLERDMTYAEYAEHISEWEDLIGEL